MRGLSGGATTDEIEQEPADLSKRRSWTAAELVGVRFAEPRWAVEGLIAEGVNLLAGAPKLGKSWLALNLGIAIASGGKALSRIDVEQGDVLYLALEDTGRRLQSRLTTILAGAPAPERLTLSTYCEAMPIGAERITRWLDDHPDARLVIVDVFTKIRGQVNDRADRYQNDYYAMSTLKQIADEYGVAFLVLHHTRKMAADDFVDGVSGTQGLAGAADAILIMGRARGSAQASLKITGRDVQEADYALDFTPATGTWHLLDGPAIEHLVGDTRRRMLELLRVKGPLTPKQIAEEIDVTTDNAKQTARRMLEDGQLDSDGNGLYFVSGAEQ